MTDNGPLQNPCPACKAGVGEPCTQPAPGGRAPVPWFHLRRGRAPRQKGRTAHTIRTTGDLL